MARCRVTHKWDRFSEVSRLDKVLDHQGFHLELELNQGGSKRRRNRGKRRRGRVISRTSAFQRTQKREEPLKGDESSRYRGGDTLAEIRGAPEQIRARERGWDSRSPDGSFTLRVIVADSRQQQWKELLGTVERTEKGKKGVERAKQYGHVVLHNELFQERREAEGERGGNTESEIFVFRDNAER